MYQSPISQETWEQVRIDACRLIFVGRKGQEWCYSKIRERSRIGGHCRYPWLERVIGWKWRYRLPDPRHPLFMMDGCDYQSFQHSSLCFGFGIQGRLARAESLR